MSEETPSYDGQPEKQHKGVRLYPSDVDTVERVRDFYELDTFSQALRRAIRIAGRAIDAETKADLEKVPA